MPPADVEAIGFMAGLTRLYLPPGDFFRSLPGLRLLWVGDLQAADAASGSALRTATQFPLPAPNENRTQFIAPNGRKGLRIFRDFARENVARHGGQPPPGQCRGTACRTRHDYGNPRWVGQALPLHGAS